jgi:rare lipoprotein A
LGTVAKVTNLRNDRSATVKIQDRGPFIAGRALDVAPKVADELDMKKIGVAPVVVAPIAVPQSDGAIKPGAGGAELDPEELAAAMAGARSAAP